MIHTVRIAVDPRDCPPLIEPKVTTGTTCALVASGAGGGNVKRCQFALGVAHEAVVNEVAVVVLEASRNCSKYIDVGTSRPITPFPTVACARAWTNPRRKLAVGTTQESAERIVRVGVGTYDGSLNINDFRKGPVTTRVWWVKRRELALRSAQEPVAEPVRVIVVSRYCPQRLMLLGLVPLKEPAVVSAPGASNVVNLPSGVRREPRYTVSAPW